MVLLGNEKENASYERIIKKKLPDVADDLGIE